jgi:hypothetical protein
VADLLAVQRSRASDLIDKHTSWWGNLAEDDLGRALLGNAIGRDYDLVQETLSELGSRNRDDVSLELMEAASDGQLGAIVATDGGRRLLDRMLDELTEGSMGDDEQTQADRILRVKGERIDQAKAQQNMLQGKVFPFRGSGMTVLDDAPIMAERRDRGQIWVKQPTRVLGTDMFRQETATLPVDVFIGGVLLPEDEIVGVKFYDLGGEVVYRPALFLVQVSNQNDTATLMKIAEVAGIGLTLGTGALVGLGVEATMAARVLLWADRAAFVIGTITSVINEHRGEIIERFGDSGRQFVRYVDIVRSATAMYGFARFAIGMGQILNGFRTSYVNWRAAARSIEHELDDGERQIIQQLSQQTDEVLENAYNIAGAASPKQAEGQPPSTQPEQPGKATPSHGEGGAVGPAATETPSPEGGNRPVASPSAVKPQRMSVEELTAAAQEPDQGGLTKAGRALQKHGSRPGSAFPKATGNPTKINERGVAVVRNILEDPASTYVTRMHPKYGEIIEVHAPDGRGIRFKKSGEMMGFLEPRQH